MADPFRLPYFDSSLFIAWLKGEVVRGIDRAAAVSPLLQAAERGRYLVCTSGLTLAEVHKLRTGSTLTDPGMIASAGSRSRAFW